MKQDIDKKLAEKWRKKLEASGFVDIEYPEGKNEGLFRDKALRRHERYDEATLTYYRAASAFLWHYDWRTLQLPNCSWELARQIWEIHAGGVPSYDIGSYIKKIPTEDSKRFKSKTKKLSDGRIRCKGGKVHKYYYYRICKELEKMCMKWNKTHHEGLFWSSDL
jgi:hypothetical protein